MSLDKTIHLGGRVLPLPLSHDPAEAIDQAEAALLLHADETQRAALIPAGLRLLSDADLAVLAADLSASLGGHAMSKDHRQEALGAFNDLWQPAAVLRLCLRVGGACSPSLVLLHLNIGADQFLWVRSMYHTASGD